MQIVEAIDRIFAEAGPVPEGPSPFVAYGISHRNPNRLRQTFQVADDKCATRPGTRERDIKMIPIGSAWIRSRTVVRYPVTKCVLLPDKLSCVSLLVGKLCVGLHIL